MAKYQLRVELEHSIPEITDDDLNQFIETSFWPAQKAHLTPAGAQRELGIINKHLGPFFSGPMSLISREIILAYVNKRLNEKEEPAQEGQKLDRRMRLRPVSGETIRKELVSLKHILRLAVKRNKIRRNPFEDIESKEWPLKGQERTRHLVGDEWITLLKAVPQVMRSAVIVLVNSGVRRGELMGLEHSDLDAETGTAWIGKTKGGIRKGKGRVVRFTPDMVELLQAEPRQKGNPKIFWAFTRSQLSVAIGRAIKRAGLENLRLNDLRHTFATTLRAAGIDLDILRKLLGHADLRQTTRYAHLGSKQLDDAVGTISGKYTGRVN